MELPATAFAAEKLPAWVFPVFSPVELPAAAFAVAMLSAPLLTLVPAELVAAALAIAELPLVSPDPDSD